MNWTKSLLATIITFSIAKPILALESSIDMTATLITTEDHAILFEHDTSSAELLALSPQEMQATKGERIRFQPRIHNQKANQANDEWNYFKYPINGLLTGALVGLSLVIGPQAPLLASEQAGALIGIPSAGGALIGSAIGIPAIARSRDNSTWDEFVPRNSRYRR
jgi:hypothetical protein